MNEDEFINSLTVDQRKTFWEISQKREKELQIEIERATHYRTEWQNVIQEARKFKLEMASDLKSRLNAVLDSI